MTLSEYMEEHELTDAKFAKLIGKTRAHVGHLRTGVRKPSVPLAIKIEQKTKGDVPMLVWWEAA